jgi:hypothetical protein
MADDKSKVSMPDRARLSKLEDYRIEEFARGLLREWLASQPGTRK